ncbi:MAG: hypothetical protein RIS45_1700 [Planctomycetota bacterium]
MKRGFVLIAVLVVIAAAILVATGAIFAARGAVQGSQAADLERRLRDTALDGVALAAEALVGQREAVLSGATPKIDAELLRVADGPRQIEVRLVPLADGQLLQSEAAKLDVNEAAPIMLAKPVESGSEVARQIVESMIARRPNSSVDAAIALVPLARALDAAREVLGPMRMLGDEREDAEDSASRARESEFPALVSLYTTLGAEPLVDNVGSPRLDLVAAFGDGAIDGPATASLERFEDVEREALQALVKESKGPLEDGAIVRALLGKGVALSRIDALLASSTCEEGAYGAPRIDIARADVRVLAALDGIGPDIAARIVDLRETLDEKERLGTSWLVSRLILTPEQYAAVAGRLTHRSGFWRFRVESRIVPAEQDEEPASPMNEPSRVYAFDCVVDISPEVHRIVFLRDVSMLPSARAIAAAKARNAEESEESPKTDRADSGEDDIDFEEGADGESMIPSPSEPRSLDLPRREATMPAAPDRAPRGQVSPRGRDIGGGGRP